MIKRLLRFVICIQFYFQLKLRVFSFSIALIVYSLNLAFLLLSVRREFHHIALNIGPKTNNGGNNFVNSTQRNHSTLQLLRRD